MNNHNWQRATDNIYGGSVVAYLLATALLFLLRLLPPWQWLLLALVTYGAITLVARRLLAERQAIVQKSFGVDPTTAAAVVGNVLREKGLPFRRHESGGSVCFELGGELSIYIQPLIARDRILASRLQLRPVTAATKPLVESLQAKLDEGFAPRAAQGVT